MDKPITNQRLGLQMTSLTDKNFVFVNPKEMLEMLEDYGAGAPQPNNSFPNILLVNWLTKKKFLLEGNVKM